MTKRQFDALVACLDAAQNEWEYYAETGVGPIDYPGGEWRRIDRRRKEWARDARQALADLADASPRLLGKRG